MRGNALPTWTAASLLLLVLLMAGTGVVNGFDAGVAGPGPLMHSPVRVEHCAAPAALLRGRPEVGRDGGSRRTAAMLLVLMAQHARVGGSSR